MEDLVKYINSKRDAEWMGMKSSDFCDSVINAFGDLDSDLFVQVVMAIQKESLEALIKKCWDEQEVYPDQMNDNDILNYKWAVTEVLVALLHAKVAQEPNNRHYKRQLSHAETILNIKLKYCGDDSN
jgi:hypothetical protein